MIIEAPAPSAMSEAVRLETTRLSATFLNGIAIGCINAGAIAPTIGLAFTFPDAPVQRLGALAALGVAWVGAGVVLHFVARSTLRRMEP